MNHETIQEMISQFIDNELAKEQHREMFMHLAECEECREFFVETIKIHDSVKTLIDEPVSDAMDRKFEILSMGTTIQENIPKMITLSMPSAILSGVIIVMMSVLLFLTVTPKQQSITEHPVDEHAMMMFQSIPSDHFQR